MIFPVTGDAPSDFSVTHMFRELLLLMTAFVLSMYSRPYLGCDASVLRRIASSCMYFVPSTHVVTAYIVAD